jgi:hypothetical protein
LAGLSALATAGGMNISTTTTGDESTVRTRIEFIAADLSTPTTGDSTGDDEGFYRVYKVGAGQEDWLRADWPGTSGTLPAISTVINCGDWHNIGGVPKFFPASVHRSFWFKPLMDLDTPQGGNQTTVQATADSSESLTTIMQKSGARCFLGGDPHLVAVSRAGAAGQKGGDDTTFTAVDTHGGAWQLYTNTPNGTIGAKRPADAKYLFPLYRGFNNSTKGVMYVNGTVGISGVVRSLVTLYSPNTVVILDDIRYANDPAAGICADILGVIAGQNVVVADNALNTPEPIRVSPLQYKSLDDTPDLYLHSVIMGIGTSFKVENYSQGPTNAMTCGTVSNGRGCLYLTGGLIQNNRGPVGQTDGHGFSKRYSYDRCAVVNPPPYFPTTGRFQDNRYYELDPVRFNVNQLFLSLTPST